MKIKEVLDRHKKWIDGKGGECGNLECADMQEFNFDSLDLQDINMNRSNLKFSRFVNANLKNANLSKVSFEHADFENANLENADLSGADLSNANLKGANLKNANLNNARITNVIGNDVEIHSFAFMDYNIVYTDTELQIGCVRRLIGEWFSFSDRQILEMDGKKALVFWKECKPVLQKIFKIEND